MVDPIKPEDGQESVWDYPRPPRLEPVTTAIRVEFAGQTVARSDRGMRVLETSHPPTYYFPPEDVRRDLLVPATGGSYCEFKGRARYWSLAVDGRRSEQAAWGYPDPTEAFNPIAHYFAFYPSRVDACYVGEEQVTAQSGDFYGGWITSAIVGPFKGGPGTFGW